MNADMGFAGSKAALNKGEYDKITLDGHTDLSNVSYRSKEYPSGIRIPSSQLVFDQKRVALNDLTGSYLSTNFSGNGTVNNLVGYIMSSQPLSGTLTAKADNMNLNDWMGTPAATENSVASTSPAGSQPFLVPAAVSFTINAAVDKVKYDKVDYNNISGKMLISDEKVVFENVKTQALDGSILINGSYSTKINKEKPDISLTYDIKDMSVQKAFNAYNTMQFLMPIGKFLSGKLHSQLSLVGNLKGNMMPLLNSLTGKGNLLLLEGYLPNLARWKKSVT